MNFGIYTLGCKVNIYESEVMSETLVNHGYKKSDFNDVCDIYIINTCSVTNNADSKCRKIINRAKNMNSNAIICVVGCYSQMSSDDIKNMGIDVILGTKDKSKLYEYIEKVIDNKETIISIENVFETSFEDMNLNTFDNKTRAFIKIQDGCNNFCTYCIIPYARGVVRSKSKDNVLSEISNFVDNDYKEVILTGIHTGAYGIDIKDYSFSKLIKDIIETTNLKRLRISSIEITELDDLFFELLKNSKVIVDHIHIPLQSGSENILKLMNRKYTKAEFMACINKIRSIRNDISITTDIIVGFPEESDNDFIEMYDFIKEINFTKLHVFPYSKRKNTKAYDMKNHVNNIVKKDRVNKLLKLSDELESCYNNKFINSTLSVLFEDYIDGYSIGHAGNYIKVKVKSDISLKNELLDVEIKTSEYPYLIGEVKK